MSAVDTNIKCLVRLKSLSLPYRGKTKSPSPCRKPGQTDCKCVAVAGVLLLWHAAVSALPLPPATWQSWSGFCVWALYGSHAALSSVALGVGESNASFGDPQGSRHHFLFHCLLYPALLHNKGFIQLSGFI